MSKTPGPGNYEHDANFKLKEPSWSLSKTPRDHSPSLKYNVGPGQYDHPNGYKKVIDSAPSYNIANKAEKLKYDINKVPGPGTYERELMKSRKSIKIAEKVKDMPGLNVPGPGVIFLLLSLTSNSNMIITHGWVLEMGDTQLLEIQDSKNINQKFQALDNTRTSRLT